MAKKRKKTAAKRKKVKTARKPIRKKTRKAAKRKAMPARKKRARKAKPKSLGDRISSAFRTVVGSVEDTEKLRAKLEQRGSDETQ